MHKIAAWLFAYACISDFLDGYLARHYNVQSKFGMLMDPIADKLLVCSVIMIFLNQGKISLMPSIAIICRELLVSGLREFLITIKVSLPVSNLGKVKTFIQMFSIFLLVIGDVGSGLDFVDKLGNVMFWISAILTLATGYYYLKEGIKNIGEEKNVQY